MYSLFKYYYIHEIKFLFQNNNFTLDLIFLKVRKTTVVNEFQFSNEKLPANKDALLKSVIIKRICRKKLIGPFILKVVQVHFLLFREN